MAKVRERVLAWLQSRPDVSPDRFDLQTRFAQSTCRHFRDGSLKAGLDVVEADFARVLALAEAGEIFSPGAGPVTITESHAGKVRRVRRARDFYVTETVRNVGVALEYAAENAAIAVITGGYGVGKTEALRHWRENGGREYETRVFEFDEFAAASVLDFIGCMADMAGVPHQRGPHTGGPTMRALCAALIEAPCLLVFDQAETVRPRVMQLIRQIWDHTRHAGVGVALLAAPVLMERLTASRMRDLEALRSRVGVWAQLTGLGRAEMTAIVKQEGITGVEPEAMEMWWRATGGSMRRLAAAIDMIRAKHAGRAVTTKTISGVAGYLWGMTLAA
jgi:DNA transposition AAA+ family ATPase